VHEHPLDLVLPRHAQQVKQMIDVRMHPAVAHQAHQVELALAAALHRPEQKLVVKERAGAEGLIDARDIHQHHTSGSHIQVPHFAIAHLPFGQSHGRSRSVNQGVWKFRQQLVVIGFARERDGVALRLGAITPAVQHGQYDWFRSFSHKRSRIHKITAKWSGALREVL